MNEFVKVEPNQTCHGCLSLSNDRQMFSLGEYMELFIIITGKRKGSIYDGVDVTLCWECMAMMKKIKKFQMQAMKAQDVLMQIVYGLDVPNITLSNLNFTTKTAVDLDIRHIDDEPVRKRLKTKARAAIKTEDTIANISIGNDNKYEVKISIENKTAESMTPNNELPHKNEVPIVNEKYENDTSTIKEDFALYDDDFDNFDLKVDVKEENFGEPVKKQRKPNSYWRKYSKDNVKLVERKKTDWGDIDNYFTTVYLDERGMEDHILFKERRYAKVSKYPYGCVECNLGYKRKLDLKRHNNLNHRKPNAPFKCTQCHKVLSSEEELIDHWREHSAMAKCNLCDKILRHRGMRQHLGWSHTKQYACMVCRMTFETLTKFGLHYKLSHMEYKCDYCNKTFTSKKKISHHISHYHIPAFCKDCDRPYRNNKIYLDHCQAHHPEKLNKGEPQELRFCVECDKKFPSIAVYRKHLQSSVKHNGVKPQKSECPECGKVFARKLYMKNHYSLYHLKKTKFYCELCDKYFARMSGLRLHNTHVHEKVVKVKDKMCDLCGRGFSNNRTMLNHRRTHTGERPHKCIYCAADFIQKYAMQSHMRTQHKHF